MLPTLACVKKEKTVDYIVGFDELGGSDDFSTHTLAARLSLHGLITYEGTEDYGGSKPPPQAKKGGMLLQRKRNLDCFPGLIHSPNISKWFVQVRKGVSGRVARGVQELMMRILILTELSARCGSQLQCHRSGLAGLGQQPSLCVCYHLMLRHGHPAAVKCFAHVPSCVQPPAQASSSHASLSNIDRTSCTPFAASLSLGQQCIFGCLSSAIPCAGFHKPSL